MRRTPMWFLGLALVFPSLITWIYFIVLAKYPASVQQSAYGIGKAFQFALPAIACFLIAREPWPKVRYTGRGVVLGALFGFTVVAAMFGLALGVLQPLGFFDEPSRIIAGKVRSMNLNTLPRFIGLGLFYALFHSLLEEYYWRWFVFRHLQQHYRFTGAVLISSAGFMAHHIILLAHYFGYDSIATYIFASAIAIGGAFWAWLYTWTQSLIGPWLSHAIIDAGLFGLGYVLIHGSF